MKFHRALEYGHRKKIPGMRDQRNPTDLQQSCHKAQDVDGSCGSGDVRRINEDKQIKDDHWRCSHYIKVYNNFINNKNNTFSMKMFN